MALRYDSEVTIFLLNQCTNTYTGDVFKIATFLLIITLLFKRFLVIFKKYVLKMCQSAVWHVLNCGEFSPFEDSESI